MDHPGDALADLRRFWDADAATYDRAPGHRPTDPAVQQAWARTLARLLPPPPAAVLDCGAGTGFLSLAAARAGHAVTAVDLSPAMLGRLAESAAAEGLEVTMVEGPATEPPPGPFDVVVERHLLWTLPDPEAALRAWRQVGERLVLFESVWGRADPLEAARARLRRRLRQWRGTPPDHHGEYAPWLRRCLPFGAGTPPAAVVAAVRRAGWVRPQVVHLDDVRRAERQALGYPERLVGAVPRFAVTAV
jgi:SAM-dependent methyltransferase